MKTRYVTTLLSSAACLLLAVGVQGVHAQSAGAGMACEAPVEVQGFMTCADVEAAKAEGNVVLYAPAGQALQLEILNEFHTLFPEIGVQTVWAQTGNLYERVVQEVATNNTLVDVLVLSDPTLLNELKGSGIFAQYLTPALGDFPDANTKSKPEGYWTAWGLVSTAIVYNTETIGDNPPENWTDLADQRYAGRRTNLKNTSSGLQFAQWKTLSDVYGREFWTRDIAALEPVAFDSFIQQFDRVVDGTDFIAINGQISGALPYIEKGAPLKIVYPEDGIPSTLEGVGVIETARNPQAARLLVDYLLSEVGQTAIVRIMRYFSARDGAPLPEGVDAAGDLNFLVPDWDTVAEERPAFEADWETVLRQ
jgi:iron(III) transport system substrate-binding protein